MHQDNEQGVSSEDTVIVIFSIFPILKPNTDVGPKSINRANKKKIYYRATQIRYTVLEEARDFSLVQQSIKLCLLVVLLIIRTYVYKFH